MRLSHTIHSVITNTKRQLSMQRPRLLRALRRFAAATEVAQNALPKRTKYPGARASHSQLLDV